MPLRPVAGIGIRGMEAARLARIARAGGSVQTDAAADATETDLTPTVAGVTYRQFVLGWDSPGVPGRYFGTP